MVSTPYDFGAKGRARLGVCTLSAGGKTISGVTAADAGKTVMVAAAGPGSASLVTTVMPNGQLASGAARAVTDKPFHVGFDDTTALNAFLAAGGGQIPDDVFLCQQPPLKYPTNCSLDWRGTILVGYGWPTGFAMMGASYGWPGTQPRLSNLQINGVGDNAKLWLSPANEDTALGRKGLGITLTDNFNVSGIKILGGKGGLFALQVHYSTHGTINAVQLAVNPPQPSQGGDGLHFIGNCSDIVVSGLETTSGDDSTSQTSEISNTANTTIERITYQNCHLRNTGHSNIKGLLVPVAAASIIQDIRYLNCQFTTELATAGNGVPVILTNSNRSGGALIRRISISGGDTSIVKPDSVSVAATAFQLDGVEDFTLENHTIRHWSRTAISAANSPGFNLRACSIQPLGTIPKPTVTDPVVKLTNSPNSSVDTTGISPSYSGQALSS